MIQSPARPRDTVVLGFSFSALGVREATMSVHPALTDEQEKVLLRKCWYSHDARWFMAVSQEFGLEAANRLNRQVCRALGQAEMRRFVRASGIAAPTTTEALVELIEAAFAVFAPPPLTQLEFRVVDDHSFEAWMKRCFIHENVTNAGIAQSYTCAAFDRVQGWHDALGLPLVEEPPAGPCPKLAGRECRTVFRLQGPEEVEPHDL